VLVRAAYFLFSLNEIPLTELLAAEQQVENIYEKRGKDFIE
jgi:hypothetical protein